MSHTLDYRRVTPSPQDAADPDSSNTPKGPRQVIPMEFDVVITNTKDQAGAGAIEQQLKREGIPVFRTHDGPIVDQTIELLVRVQDRERATEVATHIFTRRQRLKSFPRQGR